MRSIVLEALEIMKRRQYKLWRDAGDDEKKNIELDPILITEKAIKNCCPIMILRPFIRGWFFEASRFKYRMGLKKDFLLQELYFCNFEGRSYRFIFFLFLSSLI